MDLNFVYSNNSSPNFAGIFAKAYERIDESRKEKKAKSDAETKKSPDAPAEQPKPEPASSGWSPVRRGRPTSDAHASQAKAAAEAVQTYTGRATRATDGRPTPRVTSPSAPRQFDPARRRALPYQQEDPVAAAQSTKMGKHAKPEQLGKHAAGPPPAHETSPMRPGYMGRHAR